MVFTESPNEADECDCEPANDLSLEEAQVKKEDGKLDEKKGSKIDRNALPYHL